MATEQSANIDWLRTELATSIQWFKDEADKHKRVHATCRYSIFALTALSAIMASAALVVPENAQKILNVSVVAATALIGAAASVEGMRKPADKWHTERRAEYALSDIKRELEFGIRSTPQKLNADLLYARMAEILKSSGESWSKHLQAAQAAGAAATPAAAGQQGQAGT